MLDFGFFGDDYGFMVLMENFFFFQVLLFLFLSFCFSNKSKGQPRFVSLSSTCEIGLTRRG